MKHRCGGSLIAKLVEIPDTCPPIICAGHVCERCGEEVVTASTVRVVETLTAGTGISVEGGDS